MEYLQQFDSSQHLTQLEKILIYKEEDEPSENYQIVAFKACLKFRSTLIRLNLPDCDTLYQVDGTTGGALDFLVKFKNLKYRNVQNTHDPNLTLFKIQEVVPHLIGLRFESSFCIPSGRQLTMTSTPFSHIQSLDLALRKLPLHYVEQFTFHLPDCLLHFIRRYLTLALMLGLRILVNLELFNLLLELVESRQLTLHLPQEERIKMISECKIQRKQ